MANEDFAGLLEQARNGAPRSVFTPHMAAIADERGFEDETQLRLLGNAISYCPENAAILAKQPSAMQRLLRVGPLGLQVLYNGTIQNKAFAESVLQALLLCDNIEPSPPMKNLLGSVWELCSSEVPRGLVIRLVLSGFVELVVKDESLEVEPEIVEEFQTIYSHCQKISIAAEDADDFDSLGIRVVGNISSHPQFGVRQIENIPEDPFTWETVILLANVSAGMAGAEEVVAKWPNVIEKTVKLIEAEDPETDTPETETPETETLEAGNPEAEQPADSDSDEGSAQPFDLELWGRLVRNLSRIRSAAAAIARHQPAKLFDRLLTAPPLHTVAGDFAGAFLANAYDHALVETVTSEPHNGGSALIASSAVTGLDGLAREELDWSLPRLTKTIVAGLHADGGEAVWVKGTKALALLKAKYGVDVDVAALREHEVAGRSQAVQHNLDACS